MNAWLLKVAAMRHAAPPPHERQSGQIHSNRAAMSVLLLREGEELMTRVRAWINGYEIEHAKLSKKVVRLRDASTPGPDGNGRFWSIADELKGRGAEFRRALNDLLKEVGEK